MYQLCTRYKFFTAYIYTWYIYTRYIYIYVCVHVCAADIYTYCSNNIDASVTGRRNTKKTCVGIYIYIYREREREREPGTNEQEKNMCK